MTTAANGPLTAEHLARRAVVYVCQSSEVQVRRHAERSKLQNALREHARKLGFGHMEVIDEDLGTSGSGVPRPGFDRLLSSVCRSEVGLVLSLEASRLAQAAALPPEDGRLEDTQDTAGH